AGFVFRNMCMPGDTPGFRPHPGRESQWAFPGAERFHPGLTTHLGQGHFETPDQWLTRLKADTVLGFFGYSESFEGAGRVENFYEELDAFITHTLSQKYSGEKAPRLVLVSPIAYEDLSRKLDLPDGKAENGRLGLYADAMKRVAKDRGVGYVDLFTPTKKLFASKASDYTINGFALNDRGYREVSAILAKEIYGAKGVKNNARRERVYDAVVDKEWYWKNDYRVMNGVHVFGRRYNPYGNDNYPGELRKIRQMTDLRIKAIHEIASGERIPEVDDSQTDQLAEIPTNYNRPIEFLDEEEALARFNVPDGYKLELFASEKEFPDLGSPMQMAFDNKGRLWVAVMPSYPHYKPGDEKPNDKLLIFEDTDGDGRADKQTVFADGLHIPIGFELASEGVYVATQPNLSLLIDDDGDDRADREEILVHGFDSHDTHHSISSFCADPSGAIYMAEGRFLHSQVETPYGTERCTDGGVWRWDPKNWKLTRHMQTDFSNPWGIAFDDWGQMFLADASGGQNWWGSGLSAKAPHGYEIEKVAQFTTHRVRPTSGAEFISSRHFPDEIQGDFLINNTIGFLGTKQHTMRDDKDGGFTGELRLDLITSSDPNYRPCDLEFAPDGSLYIVDWHNPLIGHMQHSARDPNRDIKHGRIYRLTYPSRPLVTPAKIDGASIEELLSNLEEPEYRTRYRTRRELRGRDANEVIKAIRKWLANLDKTEVDYSRALIEGLWVTWGLNEVDQDLLEEALESDDFRVRAAAVKALRYNFNKVNRAKGLLVNAASDSHPRVRLEAFVSSTWLDDDVKAAVAIETLKHPVVSWMEPNFNTLMLTDAAMLKDAIAKSGIDSSKNENLQALAAGSLKFDMSKYKKSANVPLTNLTAKDLARFKRGKEVYERDGYCATCHAENGKGAIKDIYPPLVDSEWVKDDDDRLIKLVLKGLTGKIEVGGKVYDPANGVPPMTAFEGLLNDEEVADVLTYVRIAFGDRKALSRTISPEQVAKVREETKDKVGYYTVEELLKEHPF
ncbi:MAG: PVC-type heme-binding CxxCH protein, partial [Verrucomicrobiota bacterium]